MKVTFNPIIKNNSIRFGMSYRNNEAQMQKDVHLNGIDCISNYNIPFCSKAIYTIYYNGDIKKFPSVRKASEDSQSGSIHMILNKKMHAHKDKTFVYADEIETDGKIDFKKVNEVLSVFGKASNQPIYSIDFYGKIRWFEDINAAASKLKVSKSSIEQILAGTRDCVGDYTFIRAFFVEKRDEEGKILKDENDNPILDMDLINSKRTLFLCKYRNAPFALISKNGKVKMYKNADAAASALKAGKRGLQSAAGSNIAYKQYAVIELAKIVKMDASGNVLIDENNNYVVDEKKVKAYMKKVFCN